MDRPDTREVRTPRNPVIGIIGKSILNDREKEALRYIGRCLAILGHKLTFVPAEGTADVLREGIEAEGGDTLPIEKGVIETANHTLIYPDKRLLSRLLNAYPDLNDKDNVTVIREDQLEEWVEAVKEIVTEKGFEPPGDEHRGEQRPTI